MQIFWNILVLNIPKLDWKISFRLLKLSWFCKKWKQKSFKYEYPSQKHLLRLCIQFNATFFRLFYKESVQLFAHISFDSIHTLTGPIFLWHPVGSVTHVGPHSSTLSDFLKMYITSLASYELIEITVVRRIVWLLPNLNLSGSFVN